MTYTTPPDKATGDTVSESDWDTYIRANMIDLDARIQANTFSGCLLERTSAQSIPDSATTNLTLPTETIDEGGWFPGSGATITVPAGAIPSGYTKITVRIEVAIEWDADATGRRTVDIYKNGAIVGPIYQQDASSISFGQINNRTYWFEAGDEIVVKLFQDSGGALDLNSALVTIARVSYFN